MSESADPEPGSTEIPGTPVMSKRHQNEKRVEVSDGDALSARRPRRAAASEASLKMKPMTKSAEGSKGGKVKTSPVRTKRKDSTEAGEAVITQASEHRPTKVQEPTRATKKSKIEDDTRSNAKQSKLSSKLSKGKEATVKIKGKAIVVSTTKKSAKTEAKGATKDKTKRSRTDSNATKPLEGKLKNGRSAKSDSASLTSAPKTKKVKGFEKTGKQDQVKGQAASSSTKIGQAVQGDSAVASSRKAGKAGKAAKADEGSTSKLTSSSTTAKTKLSNLKVTSTSEASFVAVGAAVSKKKSNFAEAETHTEAVEEPNQSIPSSSSKRVMHEQPILYEGEMYLLEDDILREKHVASLASELAQEGFDPERTLAGYRIRVKQRNSTTVVETCCDYLPPGFARYLKSRRKVMAYLKGELPESSLTSLLAPGEVPSTTKHVSSADFEAVPRLKALGSLDSAKKKKAKSARKYDEHDEDFLREEYADKLLVGDVELPLPLGVTSVKRRELVIEHVRFMYTVFEKMNRIDRLGAFMGEVGRRSASVKSNPSAGISNLKDIRTRFLRKGYLTEGPDAAPRWRDLLEDIVSTVNSKTELLAALGDAQAADEQPPSQVATRILDEAKTMCLAREDQFAKDVERILGEEALEVLSSKNTEPAMPRWRKELMSIYKYRPLNTYEPAEGLLPEEEEQLMRKLVDTSCKGDRWVYPDGLDMVDIWSEVISRDRVEKSSKTVPTMKDAIERECIMEQHTWGIDCFCRRNIEIVLSKLRGGQPPRLSQIHWFIESVLLRELNAVTPIEDGWDVAKALNSILHRLTLRQADEVSSRPSPIHVTLGSENERIESDSSSLKTTVHSEDAGNSGTPAKASVDLNINETGSPAPDSDDILGRHLLRRRVKIYWAGDKQWYHGRVIEFCEPSKFKVLYDDNQEIWEDFGKQKFVLLGTTNESKYEPMSDEMLRASCKALLDHCQRRSDLDFAVHAKGIGVITKVPIESGKLIQKYTGLLYPCWLWEQKEAAEDEERLAIKRETGEVILPDFWNMRLELPKGEDDEGIDLLHVDAKTAGNFSSRMSHSCRPNCGTMTAVIDGKYCIGMRALRDIEVGEELTIDYNCVTDSGDEYRAAICLCGAHDCRGSFLFITGATQQMQIVNRSHTPLHRVAMLFAACYETGELERAFGTGYTETWPRWVTEEERAIVLNGTKEVKRARKENREKKDRKRSTRSGDATGIDLAPEDADTEASLSREDPLVKEALDERGFGKRALVSLPSWSLRFAAHIVEFIDCEQYERARVEFVKKLEETKLNGTQMVVDEGETWRSANLESKGVADQRVTNLVIALDKARHHMCERLSTNKVVDGETMTKNIAERTKLRERWWNMDRCLARWIGDDADQFPDWYPAIVTHVYVDKQELRVAYDTQHVNRIPFALARRPTLTEIGPPHTGCDVIHHQPPFRVLDEGDVKEFLWGDKISGVAARLVKTVKEACAREFPVWQTFVDSKTRVSFWWNFDTRVIQQARPSEAELAIKTSYVPKTVEHLEQLLVEKQPTNAEAARKALASLRDVVLRIPVPPSERHLEDMHQKAADILTFLSMTKNFFLLHEPENESTNSHAVINALTSWLGQGVESRLPDITEMIGTALLPPVESAYNPMCGLGYCGAMRNSLLSHLRQHGMADWPKNVLSMFPKASDLPPQPPDSENQWPHPVPPVRLFGSPAFDSALYDHLDYTKTCALAREAEKIGREEIRTPLIVKEDRGLKNFLQVCNLLREKKRDSSKCDTEDKAKFIPPPPPVPSSGVTEWVLCENSKCGKWRKVPLGFDLAQFPTFICANLISLDPSHADCAIPQEVDPGASIVVGVSDFDIETLRPGDFIDAFDQTVSEWKVAVVLEINETMIKLKYPEDSSNGRQSTRIEWVSKHQDPPVGFAHLAPLNTFTVPSSIKKRPIKQIPPLPYADIVPGADPDVGRLMVSMLSEVDRRYKKYLMRIEAREARGTKVVARPVTMTMTGVSRMKQRKVRGPIPSEQAMKYQQKPFTQDIGRIERAAFLKFFMRERAFNPEVPFVTVMARWDVMESAQKLSWEDGDEAFEEAPSVGATIMGPSLLSERIKSQAVVSVTDSNPTTRTFFATLASPSVGIAVQTDYGAGVVVSLNETSVIVSLTWGGKLHIPISEFQAQVPMFSACQQMTRLAEPNRLIGRGSKRIGTFLDAEKSVKKKLRLGRRPKPDLEAADLSQLEDRIGFDVTTGKGEPEDDGFDLSPDFPFQSVKWTRLKKLVQLWRYRWMHVLNPLDGSFLLADPAVVNLPPLRTGPTGEAVEDVTGIAEEEEEDSVNGSNEGAAEEVDTVVQSRHENPIPAPPPRALLSSIDGGTQDDVSLSVPILRSSLQTLNWDETMPNSNRRADYADKNVAQTASPISSSAWQSSASQSITATSSPMSNAFIDSMREQSERAIYDPRLSGLPRNGEPPVRSRVVEQHNSGQLPSTQMSPQRGLLAAHSVMYNQPQRQAPVSPFTQLSPQRSHLGAHSFVPQSSVNSSMQYQGGRDSGTRQPSPQRSVLEAGNVRLDLPAPIPVESQHHSHDMSSPIPMPYSHPAGERDRPSFLRHQQVLPNGSVYLRPAEGQHDHGLGRAQIMDNQNAHIPQPFKTAVSDEVRAGQEISFANRSIVSGEQHGFDLSREMFSRHPEQSANYPPVAHSSFADREFSSHQGQSYFGAQDSSRSQWGSNAPR